MELVLQISYIPLLIFVDSQITSISVPKKVSLKFSPKYRDNAITLIFAKGWDSLAISRIMVKKVAKIGQKTNFISYLARGDEIKLYRR